MSAILQNLHDAFEYVTRKASEKNKLTESFLSEMEEFLEKENNSIIYVENVERAFSLLDYFTKHKLALSGYTCDDWSVSLGDLFLEILRNNRDNDSLESQIVRFCLLHPERKISTNIVNQRFANASADEIKIIFKNLSESSLGRVHLKKNTRGKPSCIFERIEFSSMLTNVGHLRALEAFGIPLEELNQASCKTFFYN